ncbi:MAG TPA: SH3 domain-containing protein [Verrucomicrobiales bacterium]|jgi:uncharacterized protein YgiM (DUF1202 family)|nr:SH3 domain-containing protein [Verrucomicrobiales bacterium]
MKTLIRALVASCAVCCSANVRGEPDTPEPTVKGTLRVVEDPDGNSNLRSGPSLKSEVAGKIASGAVVAVVEIKGEWAALDGNGGKPRYIHTSRLQKLDKWKETSAAAVKEGKPATVKNGSFQAQVQSAPFVPADHKVKKNKEGSTTVDGHEIHGTDGTVPQKSLSLTVTVDGKAVTVPAEATRDLFEPNMETLKLLTPPKAGGPTLVVMENSDGAGAYCVAWTFTNGSYTGRVVFGQN